MLAAEHSVFKANTANIQYSFLQQQAFAVRVHIHVSIPEILCHKEYASDAVLSAIIPCLLESLLEDLKSVGPQASKSPKPAPRFRTSRLHNPKNRNTEP